MLVISSLTSPSVASAQQPYSPGGRTAQDRYRGAPPDEPAELAERYADKRHAALMIGFPVAVAPSEDRFGVEFMLRLGYRVIPPLMVEVFAGWRTSRSGPAAPGEPDRAFWSPAFGLGLRGVIPWEVVRPYAAARVLFGWWRYVNPPEGVLTSYRFAPSVQGELGAEFRVGKVVLHAALLINTRFSGRAFDDTQIGLGPEIGIGFDY